MFFSYPIQSIRISCLSMTIFWLYAYLAQMSRACLGCIVTAFCIKFGASLVKSVGGFEQKNADKKCCTCFSASP